MKLILFTTLALIMVGSLSIFHGVGFEEKASAAQAGPIAFTCPKEIQVGPVAPPNGWQSLGSIPRYRFSITVDIKSQLVVCWYGDVKSPFTSYLISQKIPEGYECKIPYPADFQAICTKKTRGRTDD